MPKPKPTAKRSYWRESDAERVLADLQASGQTTADFARRHGLSAARLYRWQARLGARTPQALFVACTPEAPTAAHDCTEVELLLGDSVRIRVPRGFCSDTLSRLLDVLGGPPAC